jgi:hypothetical protein
LHSDESLRGFCVTVSSTGVFIMTRLMAFPRASDAWVLLVLSTAWEAPPKIRFHNGFKY